jgi:hypothetical protein
MALQHEYDRCLNALQVVGIKKHTIVSASPQQMVFTEQLCFKVGKLQITA